MINSFNIKNILVAPLDWGLGHATRCIPIIQALQQNGYNVIIAASGKGKIILQEAFPNTKCINIVPYNISYTKQKWLLPFSLLLQLPKINKVIAQEQQWLQAIIQEENIHLVISDNRFGLYSSTIPAVFITHQLTIKAPLRWAENWLQKINYRFINRYTACWVPDVEGDYNLAGVLSHPIKKPTIPVHYLGCLTRFTPISNVEKKYQYCFILSGPEPQRTLLETSIMQYVANSNAAIVVVRGLPDATDSLKSTANVTIFNHLNSNKLNQLIAASEFVIGRSGYTSVMDLISLQAKCFFIPTPGQTEQEYLAEYLHSKNLCYTANQQHLNWHNHLQVLQSFNFRIMQPPVKPLNSLLPQIINQL